MMALTRKTRRFSASSSPKLGIPKGRPRRRVKGDKKAAQNVRIAEVRAAVWARSAGRCEITGEVFKSDDEGEMHETYPRSKTRGMRPEARFDTRWCVRVTAETHRFLTANKLRVYFSTLQGANVKPYSWWRDDEGWRHYALSLCSPEDVWKAAVGR